MAGKKTDGFNTPFKALKLAEKKAPDSKSPGKARASPPSERQRSAKVSVSDEEREFHMAMAEVSELSSRPPAPVQRAIVAQLKDDDAETLASLAQLVSEHGDFAIAGSDDFIEGGSGAPDPRLLGALKKGQFPVQGQVDLHGMTRDQARVAVENFVVESRRNGKRCILIVHGRGLHSENQIPVIKGELRGWLQRGRVGKSVLAFATARPQDGGTGAIYVLLRK